MLFRSKIVLLAEWDAVRLSVKKGLKRLGHDIVLVPIGSVMGKKEDNSNLRKEGKENG